MSTQLDDLIGKVITSVKTNTDNTFISFEFLDGTEVTYIAEGDCYSHSWIAHLNGLDYLIGQTVTSIIERDLHHLDAETPNGDETKVYGWTVTTSLGYFDLEMRNLSSGYYGGYLEKLTPKTRLYNPIPQLSHVLEDF